MKASSKHRALSLAVAISATLVLAAPAIAQDDILTLAPASDWRLEQMPDRCQLTRLFGTGDGQMRMTIEKGGADPTFNLTLIGDAVANPLGPLISVQFGDGEQPFGRNYITAETRSGKPVITLYGASFAASIPREDGGYTFDEQDDDRLAAMNFLQIERAGLTPFRLDFGESISEQMTAMTRCTQSLVGALAVAPTGQSRPSEPKNSPARWMLPKDYPRMMINYRKEGRVKFRLTVSPLGQPSFCAIEETTLPQMFDDAVCLAMMRNAQFEPALDWAGNPIASYWRNTVVFEIR